MAWCVMDRAAETERLARTYVWWQEPAATLANPHKLLCQILRLGRAEDYVAEAGVLPVFRSLFERARWGTVEKVPGIYVGAI